MCTRPSAQTSDVTLSGNRHHGAPRDGAVPTHESAGQRWHWWSRVAALWLALATLAILDYDSTTETV